MKSILFALFSFAISAQAAYILHPESGDQYQCVDDVSGFTYHLTIVDIGDKEADVKVYNRQGRKVDHYKPSRSHQIAMFRMNSSGMEFDMLKNGRYEAGINFEVYDLNTAYYSDRGDARALECEIVKP